jgi:uncharacterized protein YbjT (DUF2867 family)
VTAFVAGATGYTGRELIRILAETGRDPVAHVRPDSNRVDEWRQRFESLGARVDTTAWDEAAMTATLRALAPDVVFALLGTTRKRGRQSAGKDTYESVDYGLTSLLLRACVASGARPRFVYLSAVGVTPDTKNAYLAARARIERELRESGLPFCIARPSFVTGPDRDDGRATERLSASILDATMSVAGLFGAKRAAARYRSTSNTTLASALARVGYDPALEGAVLESESLH